jgi:parallel beta-helix repeat protein
MIDASHAGVILDGSNLPDGFNAGISIHSHGNTVRGMKVVGFAGAGIAIDFGQNNLIENNVSCRNDFGIGIWGVEAAANTIIGNYIGVLADDVTQRGNRTAGITIMESTNGNFIGPGNLIAYNGRAGIEIYHANTTGNLISQNSIHDNGERGIHLWDGGNREITAPAIFDFDLKAGTVAGTSCDGCTVEIFSDSSDEGAIFEGQIGTDSNGVFAFEKGTAFAGAYLTATAHDDHGVAVEDDPGIKATLTIPNFSAAEVVGIDVLFGFEQQLIVDAEGGNLVVRDLLVKDYPIFLRAENVSSP